MASIELAEKVRKEIIETGVDDRYKTGAYEFVLHGVEFFRAKLGDKRHVSGQELSVGLLVFAHKQYGPMAKSVLVNWGITATEDLGNIVYNLIRLGLMSKQPQDSLDDFYNVVNIDNFFEHADNECFEVDKEFLRRR